MLLRAEGSPLSADPASLTQGNSNEKNTAVFSNAMVLHEIAVSGAGSVVNPSISHKKLWWRFNL